jgi:polyhydroxyalkanoate synthase
VPPEDIASLQSEKGDKMSTEKHAPSGSPADIAALAAERMLGPNPFVGLRTEDVLAGAGQIAGQALMQPALLLEQEAKLVRDLMEVLVGGSEITPEPGDKRFLDEAWKSNPIFRMAMQGHLAWGKALGGLVEQSQLDVPSKERASFVVSLLTGALAPTNTILGNPGALKKIVETGGLSLVNGLQNMLQDLTINKGMPAQTDMKAFQVGKDLAKSPGAVVFRNPVLELIQYSPSTPTVYARPHLMVPPQVNKFYVFDLAPGKSLVELLVNSGFQTFVVSWRNPTPEQRDWDLDTYVEALVEAIAAMRDITGAADINIHGACSGAMTMSALLSYLAARKQRVVNAATLMVAVLDNRAESQLGLFATPQAVKAAKLASRSKGVLEGQEMGRVFAWMRPNDLVWNYWVNNYLMGNAPPVFDILFWNNDTTRLPAKFHAQLIDSFVGNQFTEPGAMTVLGTPLDLTRVDCDKYLVAGVTDHITPWKGVFNTARAFGGHNEFVLSSSGHIQSLINPPGNPKSKFLLNPAGAASPEEWLAGAQTHAGTWWNHWREWLVARSGKKRKASAELGNANHPPLDKAPGTYVSEP